MLRVLGYQFDRASGAYVDDRPAPGVRAAQDRINRLRSTSYNQADARAAKARRERAKLARRAAALDMVVAAADRRGAR